MKKFVRIYRQVELRAMERGFINAVEPVKKDIDATLASVPDVACKKSCAHCCKLRVEVLPPEAALIVDHVRRSFPPSVRQGILDKLKANAPPELLLDAHQYRAEERSCAFLGDDDLCMVYDQRPISCRAFGSTNVNVCNLSEPDDGQTTFSAAPDSYLMLVGTSGLFWTGLHGACLAYWMGLPIETVVDEDVAKSVFEVRQELDQAARERREVTLKRT